MPVRRGQTPAVLDRSMRMLSSGRQERMVARSADVAQQPRMVPGSSSARALLQPEPSPLDISAEILALRHGILTGLILAPAVLFRLAEAGDIALSALGEDAINPFTLTSGPRSPARTRSAIIARSNSAKAPNHLK